jgi:hypothetical protein
LRQTREAAKLFRSREDVGAEAALPLIEALERELGSGDGNEVAVESVYVRSGLIGGGVLNDSFHFGQTWRDDMGRPFGQGWNRIVGAQARFQYGAVFGGVRGEYQGAPAEGAYGEGLRELVARLDNNPVSAVTRRGAMDRGRVVEGYVGVAWRGWTVTAGQQGLYWGPGEQAPLSFSNNAEPTANVRLRSPAVRLPGVGRYLGAIRGEFVAGKLGGHRAAVVQRTEAVVQIDREPGDGFHAVEPAVWVGPPDDVAESGAELDWSVEWGFGTIRCARSGRSEGGVRFPVARGRDAAVGDGVLGFL